MLVLSIHFRKRNLLFEYFSAHFININFLIQNKTKLLKRSKKKRNRQNKKKRRKIPKSEYFESPKKMRERKD